ncbi:VPLPA-CTERM sorting domain-containing protein [Primorskyibacter sp. S187A]|uniref:VPLPA-CTERM sorting domain-containing protein n=1 Tax=Primorskyibacter sp. S187A TaxID=3415130 RepID=UPI003C79D42E
MIKTSLIGAFLIATAGAASAATVDLIGDKDCFGTNDVCVEDGTTWLPGGWSAVTQDGLDPTFMDITTNGGSASWTHSYAAGTYSSASLSFRTAGIADIAGPYDVLVDGVKVGEMPLDGSGHILVETFTFAVDTALVNDGAATVSFVVDGVDTWAIDYSELTLGMTTAPVPLPAGLPLLLAGLGGLALVRRRSA